MHANAPAAGWTTTSPHSNHSDCGETVKIDGECMLTARKRMEDRFRQAFVEARKNEAAEQCGNSVKEPSADWRKQ
jgi:hypothetical protein